MEVVLEKDRKENASREDRDLRKNEISAGEAEEVAPRAKSSAAQEEPTVSQRGQGTPSPLERPMECVETMVDSDGVWWRTYEEPDKSIEDYTTREIGVAGEFLAARYLAHHGYEILTQNWRTKFGEVDIVCRNSKKTVVLVEVKSRLVLTKDRDAMPELAVDAKKQHKYRKLGLVYLMQHPEVDSLRFDVMAINFLGRHTARLRRLVGAFDCDF